MAQSFAFANRGTIDAAKIADAGPVTGSSAYTDIVGLGVVKDVEIAWSAEHMPLYGWGETTRQAVARHTEKVSVKIGWCKFDPTVATWFPMGILRTLAATTAGTSTKTNAVRLFTITAHFTMEDGTLLKGIVNNVYFPDFPIKAAEGQWLKVDLNGDGTDVVWSNTA